jgi:CHAT domain
MTGGPFKRVLVVLPKQLQEMHEAIREVLDGFPDAGSALLDGDAREGSDLERAPPVLFHNKADALAWARQRCDLVIAHLEIPADRKSVLDPTAHLGLALVKSLRNDRVNTPTIILAETLAGDIDDEIEGTEGCEAVTIGIAGSEAGQGAGAFEKNLADGLKRLLEGQKPDPMIIEIDFNVETQHSGPRDQRWTIKSVSGTNRFDPPSGCAHFNLERLQELAQYPQASDSTPIHRCEHPLWERKLRSMGRLLRKELFADLGFTHAFNKAKHRAGGMKNLTIRFTIREELNPVLLEFLVEDDPDNAPFWMEEASLTRRLRTRSGSIVKVPSGPQKPINCLIVKAALQPGAFHEEAGALTPLANLEPECDRLLQLVDGCHARSPSLFNKPVVVSAESARSNGRTFREELQHQLTSGNVWHLVHLGGHQHYDSGRRVGGLFVPDENPNGTDRIELPDLAKWLSAARTHLLFLSSCRDSSDQVALVLAEAVPALVGFRWEIPDEQAVGFTALFYEKLLVDSGSVRRSFLSARKELSNPRDRDKQVWAASMLVIEPDDLEFPIGEGEGRTERQLATS